MKAAQPEPRETLRADTRTGLGIGHGDTVLGTHSSHLFNAHNSFLFSFFFIFYFWPHLAMLKFLGREQTQPQWRHIALTRPGP